MKVEDSVRDVRRRYQSPHAAIAEVDDGKADPRFEIQLSRWLKEEQGKEGDK